MYLSSLPLPQWVSIWGSTRPPWGPSIPLLSSLSNYTGLSRYHELSTATCKKWWVPQQYGIHFCIAECSGHEGRPQILYWLHLPISRAAAGPFPFAHIAAIPCHTLLFTSPLQCLNKHLYSHNNSKTGLALPVLYHWLNQGYPPSWSTQLV